MPRKVFTYSFTKIDWDDVKLQGFYAAPNWKFLIWTVSSISPEVDWRITAAE